MTIFNIISMFGGLALFLYGMEVMGDGLKNSSGTTLKSILEKVTTNTLLGILVGTLVTAIIQSSTATIVLTVGLMGAGILTLKQATGIIMGANIGTTITAQMIRLMDINSSGAILLEFCKPETLAPLAAILGIILIMFVKSDKTKNIGQILLGFGVLFIGLMNMTSAVDPLTESPTFVSLLTKFGNMPVLGILVGTGVTALIQSSSASIGILQALSSTGVITFNAAYPIVMGCNIGSCVTTAIVCSIGTGDDAKRASLVHIFFNVVGVALFLILLAVLRHAGFWPDLWNGIATSGDIANFQTIFKLVTAIALFPFTNKVIELSYKVIKTKNAETEDYSALNSLDEKLFISPAIAVRQASIAITKMARIAQKNIRASINQLDNYDSKVSEKIYSRENKLDEFTDVADNYLIKLAGYIENDSENRELNVLIQAITDFERIGDYAVNIEEVAKQIHSENLSFSEGAKDELKIITSAIDEIIETTIEAFEHSDPKTAKNVEPLEEVIDELVDTLRSRHVARLKSGACTINVGLHFIEILTNFERAADQCSNISVFVLGKNDSSILNNHHSYLRELHKGNDPMYSATFNDKYKKYISSLENI